MFKQAPSGGERQRVGIARAVMRNRPAAVFDEATSSLDSTTEAEVQAALVAASAGRTTLTIAHRLSTIVDSDIIFVLEKGAIIEQGTYAELMELDGAFAELWRTQARIGQKKKND